MKMSLFIVVLSLGVSVGSVAQADSDGLTVEEIVQQANHMALYQGQDGAGKVTMVDRWFGYFMDKLDHMGLHEDTAVVVVSDHGHPLGEHGMWRKVPAALRFNMLNDVMLMSLPDKYQSHGKGIPPWSTSMTSRRHCFLWQSLRHRNR